MNNSEWITYELKRIGYNRIRKRLGLRPIPQHIKNSYFERCRGDWKND